MSEDDDDDGSDGGVEEPRNFGGGGDHDLVLLLYGGGYVVWDTDGNQAYSPGNYSDVYGNEEGKEDNYELLGSGSQLTPQYNPPPVVPDFVRPPVQNPGSPHCFYCGYYNWNPCDGPPPVYVQPPGWLPWASPVPVYENGNGDFSKDMPCMMPNADCDPADPKKPDLWASDCQVAAQGCMANCVEACKPRLKEIPDRFAPGEYGVYEDDPWWGPGGIRQWGEAQGAMRCYMSCLCQAAKAQCACMKRAQDSNNATASCFAGCDNDCGDNGPPDMKTCICPGRCTKYVGGEKHPNYMEMDDWCEHCYCNNKTRDCCDMLKACLWTERSSAGRPDTRYYPDEPPKPGYWGNTPDDEDTKIDYDETCPTCNITTTACEEIYPLDEKWKKQFDGSGNAHGWWKEQDLDAEHGNAYKNLTWCHESNRCQVSFAHYPSANCWGSRILMPYHPVKRGKKGPPGKWYENPHATE